MTGKRQFISPDKDDRALVAAIIRDLTRGTNLEKQANAKANAVLQGRFDNDSTVQAAARFRLDASRDFRRKLARLADWLENNFASAEALATSNPREIANRTAKVAADIRAYLASLTLQTTTEEEPSHG